MKKLPYWIKGLLIGIGVIVVIRILLILNIGLTPNSGLYLNAFCMEPNFSNNYCFGFNTGLISYKFNGLHKYLAFPFLGIKTQYWFVLASTIAGWIYGKIKKREKAASPQRQ